MLLLFLLSFFASFFFLFSVLTHTTANSASKQITVSHSCHTEISQARRSWCAKFWRPDKTYRYVHKRIQHMSKSSAPSHYYS
jgi:hypothetical protein